MIDLKNYPEIDSVRNLERLSREVAIIRQGEKKQTLIQFLNGLKEETLRKGLIKARLYNLKYAKTKS